LEGEKSNVFLKNPGNESFTCDKNSKIYVDKTGLIEYLNSNLGTAGKCSAFYEPSYVIARAYQQGGF
jgi:hypothetical protein